MRSLRAIAVQLLIAISVVAIAPAQQKRTTDAFDQYVASAEARITQSRGKRDGFLWVESLPTEQGSAIMSRLRDGQVVIEKQGDTPTEVPGGLIHDWIGTVLVPKVTVAQVLALIQDYDHSSRDYAPDVEQSQLVSRQGDNFQVFMRLHKHKFITVVLDTEYSVQYGRLDPAHQFSLSRSTRVTEIAEPGTPGEHAVPAGKDHGFMWRLNSYWAFEQTDDGVLIECEAISLTRDIPAGLAWMIGPFVKSIPRESLQFTLDATGKALAGTHREH